VCHRTPHTTYLPQCRKTHPDSCSDVGTHGDVSVNIDPEVTHSRDLMLTQETVRQLMCLLDPEGVTLRKHRRLQRRSYYSGGPNAVWHIDGYDKLKKYGIAIHGCIDGFSRHIIWLHAYTTNNDPRVIAGYFVDAVESLGGCPRKIRSDRGTENVYVEQIQLFLREETQSYMYGTSINNQRIESWWAILRRQMMQFWINVFEKLKEEDLFCGSFLDKSLMQFCFLNLIQVCSCLLTLMPLLQYCHQAPDRAMATGREEKEREEM